MARPLGEVRVGLVFMTLGRRKEQNISVSLFLRHLLRIVGHGS